MIYLRLFYEFAKTGLFAVGGGMATIPFLYAISEKTGWFTAADIGNMIAISESTPGSYGCEYVHLCRIFCKRRFGCSDCNVGAGVAIYYCDFNYQQDVREI